MHIPGMVKQREYACVFSMFFSLFDRQRGHSTPFLQMAWAPSSDYANEVNDLLINYSENSLKTSFVFPFRLLPEVNLCNSGV